MAEARRAVCDGLEDWQQPSDLLPPPPAEENSVANPAAAEKVETPSESSEENPSEE